MILICLNLYLFHKYSGISIKRAPLVQKKCTLYRAVGFPETFSRILWPQSKAIRPSSYYPSYRGVCFIGCPLYRDSTVFYPKNKLLLSIFFSGMEVLCLRLLKSWFKELIFLEVKNWQRKGKCFVDSISEPQSHIGLAVSLQLFWNSSLFNWLKSSWNLQRFVELLGNVCWNSHGFRLL